MVKRAMIMAAGVGSRLDPLTKSCPKPLIPIVNQPVIELILKKLAKLGIKNIIANTHYLADQIHARYEDSEWLGINFNYIHEKKLSGTAGGVKACEWFLTQDTDDNTFIVMSADGLTDVNLEDLINKHKKSGAIATMGLKEVPMSEVKHFGVIVTDENERVIEFQEKPSIEEAKSNLVNTGIYVFEKEIFNYIPENTFYDFAKNVFPALMENNEIICGHVIEGYWCDIGTINQYRMSSNDILNGKMNLDLPYEKNSFGWASESAKFDKTSIVGKAIIGDHTEINPNAKIYGNCVIGNNCIIEEGAKIRNSIIWDNAVIAKNANIDGCILGYDVTIEANSNLNVGDVIASGEVLSSYYVHN